MKWIEYRDGNKTICKYVPDDYEEPKKETPQADLTTGGASLISVDMTKEEHDRIFGKK